MWSTLLLILAALGIIACHIGWRRRFLESERKLAKSLAEETRLRESLELEALRRETHQQALINSMFEGFLLVDAEGRIQAVNDSLLRLFHLKPNLTGKTLMEGFRLSELCDLNQRVAKELRVRGIEIELRGLEQRTIEVNASALLNQQNQQHGTIFTFHDTTRLKNLENTRREFVANVSHELRTPLTLIKGFVETLLDGAKNDPVIATRFLQTIDKHTDRLTFLIEDLLTISKLESAPILLNLGALVIFHSVDQVFDDLQSKAMDRRMTLVNVVDKHLECWADDDRLQQVLFNLVDNAIKYGRPEGKVTVSAQIMQEKFLDVSVADDGPGIPAEAKERVFERFYRVDKARSRDQGGTGLGLSIVKHIVLSHGGEVWVDSQVGQGSAFHFTLPLAKGGKPLVSFDRVRREPALDVGLS